jgi:hypothetical protein
MKLTLRFLALAVLVAFALTGLSLWAATQNAVVIGFVLDQTGAPVPNATVRLLNAGTGFARVQATDDYGSYTFTNVPPAPNYTIIVAKSGFATGIRSNVPVAVGDSKQVVPAFFLQASAQPGQEVRETQAEARTIAPELVSNTLGGVIDSSTLRTLPLPNRDFLDLALLIPGAYPVEQGSALQGASLVVNGVRADMNNFLLDGADNNDYTVNQSLPFQLVEALQEFRLQASTSSPEFGRNAGAQINSVTRSGSNDWHGTVFWFNRVDALSANSPISHDRGGTFDAFAQAARVDQVVFGPATFFPDSVLSDPALSRILEGGREPGFTLNQFGANVGGPVAKDKAFFFFNWESFRADNDRPVFERVPDNFFRDFSNALFQDDDTIRVNQLLNLFPVPNVPASTVTSVFGFPVSDPATGDVRCLGVICSGAFFAGDANNFTETDNILGRLDVQPTDRITMSFKYNIQLIKQLQAGSLPQTSDYPGNGIELDGRNQNFSYNYVHQFSSRWVNEFRFGWNRFRLDALPQDRGLATGSIFNNQGVTNKGAPSVYYGGFQYTSGPYAPLGASFAAPIARADNVLSFADNVTLVWGRHVLKAGGEYRYNRLNVTNEALGRGLVTFYAVDFGADYGTPDLASVARVSPEFGGGFDRRFSAFSFSWFVQDTWRPRQDVSLTYGLRHEVNQAPREAHDRLVNNYPAACAGLGGSNFACLMRSGDSTVYDSDFNVLGTASFTAPRAGFKTDWNNFGPHVGLAWDPWSNGKTVFRAAYAMMFDQQSLQPSVNMLHNPPFVTQWSSFYPFLLMGDTFPAGFPTVDVDLLDVNGDGNSSFWFRQPYSITARDPGTRTSYIQQFNVGIQQQVGNSSLFEVAYVGSMGHKLPRNRLALECSAATFSASPNDCVPSSLGGGGLTDSMVVQENSANSNFHSLQLSWETRNLKGLSFRLLYQWAHSIDGASSANAPVFLFSPYTASLVSLYFGINADNFAAINNANPALSLRPGFPIITTRGFLPNDSANLAGERASSDFDIRHRFIVDYIWDVPRWAPGVGEGWQLAGIFTFQSGQPYTVFGDFFGIPLRPDLSSAFSGNVENNKNPLAAIDGGLVAGCNVSLNLTCDGTADVSAFDPNVILSGLPGSLGRNTFEGPGLVNFDFSVLKNTYLGAGERVNLQFRVEFFNLINHVNYRQPFSQTGQFLGVPGFNYLVPNPFFGQILQAQDARRIQIGLKLIF